MKTETKLNQHDFHTFKSYKCFRLNSFKMINGLFWTVDGAPDNIWQL